MSIINKFIALGIHDRLIYYAHNNHNEFIAVAAQVDMSQYSPEFKKCLLILVCQSGCLS